MRSLAGLLAAFGLLMPAFAQSPVSEPQLKAAFVLNFLRYVEWPEKAFPSRESPIPLCRIGSDDGDKVMAQMKKTKGNDIFAKDGYIRDDGRMVHDMYLMQVKSPDKSVEPWDYYNVVETFKGEAAWQTKADSKCPLWK